MATDIKSKLRRLIAIALYYTGALWVLARFILRGRVVVLMYHRVLPSDTSDSFSAAGIRVSPATFELHMRFLKRFFTPLAPQELAQVLTGERPVPRNACAVTFDDGWFDNHQYALPILRRHGVPAIIFVATDYIGTGRCFWQERLTRILFLVWRDHRSGAGAELFRDLDATAITALDELRARDAIRLLVTSLKSRTPEQIESIMSRGAALLGGAHGNGDDRFLSWPEVDELARSQTVWIGSHAQSHTPLPRLSAVQAMRELVDSRAQISAHLAQPIDTFAYPNGDHSPQSVLAVRNAGYRLAFTTQSRLAQPGDDPLRIPRVNVHEGGTATPAEFLSRILRLF